MALPVTVDDARTQLQLGGDLSRNAELVDFIEDAAAWVEGYTGHLLARREVTEAFANIQSIALRCWPIATDVAPRVTIDGMVFNGARLSLARRPVSLALLRGQRWPVQPSAAAEVSVTVVAGYASPDDVPRDLRRAMLVLIAAYDADREGGDLLATAEKTARALCRRYRITRL